MPVITTKGQVTIPKAVRDRHGLRPGDRVEFAEVEGKVVVCKVPAATRLRRWIGSIDLGEPVDSFVRRVRGKR